MTTTVPYWFLCNVDVIFVQGAMPLISAACGHVISPFLPVSLSQTLSSNALILRGNQLVDQNNYCQYGHVYVCIWIITVIPPLRDRVKRVIRTSTYSVWSLTDGTCSHTGGTRSVTHTETHEGTRTHCGPPSAQQGHDVTKDSGTASYCEATDGLLVIIVFEVAFLMHL